MKAAGWLLVIAAIAVIYYHAFYLKEVNEREVRNHPIKTLVSGGANLKLNYTFQPPYTAFEICVMGMGVIGIVLILVGKSSP